MAKLNFAPGRKQKKLNDTQLRAIKNLKPGVKGAMVRHAKAKMRSIKHNDAMIRLLKRGNSVSEAHKKAVKKVGY